MKKFKVIFPVKLADAFAEFVIANDIKVIFSWTAEAGFLEDTKAHAVCAVNEDKIEAIKANETFKKYLTA